MQNQLTTQMSSVPNAVVVTTYTGSKSTSSTFNNILAHVSLLRSARRFIGVYKAVCEGEKTSRSFDLAYKNFVNQDSISLAPQNDIANIEKGLIVLHGAYQSAKKDKQIFACADIAHTIASISAFYQAEVSSAYSLASNALLDAPANTSASELNNLKIVRLELKKTCQTWPTLHIGTDLSLFWDKVSFYAKEQGIDLRILPEKKCLSVIAFPDNSKNYTR